MKAIASAVEELRLALLHPSPAPKSEAPCAAAATPTPASPAAADTAADAHATILQLQKELREARRRGQASEADHERAGAERDVLHAALHCQIKRGEAAVQEAKQRAADQAATVARCQDAERALQVERERVQRLERRLQSCQDDVCASERQWVEAQEVVASLSDTVHRLTLRYADVQGRLTAAQKLCDRLETAERERSDALDRLALLEESQAAQAAALVEGQHSLALAEEQVRDGVAYWAAVREEHEELKAALCQSQVINLRWAEQFVQWTAGGEVPRDVDAIKAATTAGCRRSVSGSPPAVREAEGSAETGAVTTRTVAELVTGTASLEGVFDDVEMADTAAAGHSRATSTSLLSCLEAKVIDLALSLQDARSAEAAAVAQSDALLSSHWADTAAVLTLQAAMAAAGPCLDTLQHSQLSLQAALTVAEGFGESLLSLYAQLLDLYTSEAAHAYDLEVQLAEKVCLPPPRPAARLPLPMAHEPLARRHSPAAVSSGTAPQIQHPLTVAAITTGAGGGTTRHTLNFAALRQMEQQQHHHHRQPDRRKRMR